MAKTVKPIGYVLEEIEALKVGTSDWWVLKTEPIPNLSRAAYVDVVEKRSRIDLWHKSWDGANSAARELSDVGGIRSVTIVRIRRQVTLHATFVEGKQVPK